MSMRVICAWCEKDLGTKDGPEGEVSHGICLDCTRKLVQEVDDTKAPAGGC